MGRFERQEDLLKIIAKLDITPTMYRNAEEKYKSITSYLNQHGLVADMYPQGSFALGTVVRPSTKKANAAYDLDVVCQVTGSREDTTPSELWNKVGALLKESSLYGGKLTEYEKCFTVEYAEVDGYGFSIDIVPATDEDEEIKDALRKKSVSPELMDTAIALPKHSEKSYRWATNNPRGYRAWFETINKPFADNSWDSVRKNILSENRTLFSSVEEIPRELNRSSVQRVIQILKYHRDVYYGKLPNGDNLKPISAIISTIVAKIASTVDASLTTFDLLDYVTQELATYSKHQTLNEATFSALYGARNVIERRGGSWRIENPANPEDNLADAWNRDPEIPKRFFGWANIIREDLIESLELSDEAFRVKAESAFGQRAVEKAWGTKYNAVPAKSVSTTYSPKPWRVR